MPHSAMLDSILNRDADAIHRQQLAEFRALAPAGSNRIILFGAGWLGRETAKRLRASGEGFELYFCDNNPAVSGEVDGIPVLGKAEALAQSETASVVVTIFNNSPVEEQLRAEGFRHVMSFVTLYRAYPDAMLPLGCLVTPQVLLSHAAKFREAFALLADEESRQEFAGILDWNLRPAYTPLPRLHRQSEIYYTPDLVKRLPDERYVDCGAFDGDSIGYFMQKWDGAFGRIAAFEPIDDNYARLTAYRATLPAETQAKIDLHKSALCSKAGQISFSVAGNASSTVRGEQEVTVDCAVLDDVLADFHPSLIKMDIEGAEPDALRGAARILKEDVPLLTICTYHDISHMWEIPLLIHATNPDYTLYFRRYAQDSWETVCYAIPPGRAV